jgi:hypothetical protein
MPLKKLIAVLAVVALALFGAASQARTQTPIALPGEAPPPRHVRGRITIHPRPLLYRRCVDWYELQHRESGTVLYPQMRCWWVRR